MNEPLESLQAAGRHLDDKSLDAYRKKKLNPSALLQADDHLANCQECRSRAADNTLPIGLLRRSLAPYHLTGTELELFAEDFLTDPIALEHLEECASCREDANDLWRFVHQGSFAPAPKPATSIWGRIGWWPAAAAVCATLVAGGIFIRSSHQPIPASSVAPRPLTTRIAPEPAATVAILPDELRDLRNTAIATGRLQIPSQVAALRGERETQLGGVSTQDAIDLETPLRTGTISTRPEFRWKAVPNAQSYEVAVFDRDFRKVVSSGALRDTRWTPPRDLAEGVVYEWELTVLVDGTLRTAPRPPASPARFLVLKEAERNRLSQIRAEFPQEHLLLGVVLANAGALDEARRELQSASLQGDRNAAKLLGYWASGK